MSSWRRMSLKSPTDLSFGSQSGSTRHAREHAVAHLPEDEEAVPLAVRRHVRVEPAQARARPRRGSRRSGRATAACAGTRAARRRSGAISGMNCTALAPVPITATRLPRRSTIVVPARGVEGRPRERVAALDVGKQRPVELTDRADHRVRVRCVCSWPSRRPHLVRSSARSASDHVADSTSVPNRMYSAEVERVGAPPEVVEQHVLGGEVQRPVVALRERVAVVVVRVVDAAARIAVLEPGAADVVVLLDDHERHARLVRAGARRAAPTCPRR